MLDTCSNESYLFSSFALYGLIMFYGLTHEELKGRRPLAKFLSIKLIVMFTFYQSFVVSHIFSRNSLCSFLTELLSFSSSSQLWRGRLFTVRSWDFINIYICAKFEFDVVGNQFWTATNIADGLTALTTCIEVRSIFNLHVSEGLRNLPKL